MSTVRALVRKCPRCEIAEHDQCWEVFAGMHGELPCPCGCWTNQGLTADALDDMAQRCAARLAVYVQHRQRVFFRRTAAIR